MVSQKTLQSEDLIIIIRTGLVQSFKNTSSAQGHNFRVSVFCLFGWSDTWFLWWSDQSDDWFLWWSDRSDGWLVSWMFTTAWPRIVFDLMSILKKIIIAEHVPARAIAIGAYSMEPAAI
jgi:hypothetical protein